MEANQNSDGGKSRWKTWAKRSGIAVFLFFLLKGLMWIGIAVAIWMGFTK